MDVVVKKRVGAVAWVGRVISALLVLFLLMGAYMGLTANPVAVEGMTKYGFPPGVLKPLGVVEAACAVLYVLPWTAPLGAVLITGYLGGAVATHVRAGENWEMPVVFGVLVWVALLLRDPRLWRFFPIRWN